MKNKLMKFAIAAAIIGSTSLTAFAAKPSQPQETAVSTLGPGASETDTAAADHVKESYDKTLGEGVSVMDTVKDVVQ